MTRTDAYLLQNSLRLILKLLEQPSLSDEAKARMKDEIASMLQAIDQLALKQI